MALPRVATLVALFCMTGCTRSPEAVGALLFTPEAAFAGDPKRDTATVANAFFATQSEVIAATGLLQRVIDQARFDGGVDGLRRSIRTQRRGESLVLDVRTTAADPHTAALRCDLVLRGYLEQRLESQLAVHRTKAQWLAQQLDGKPDPTQADALKAELRKEELASQMVVSDARILEPCRPTAR